MWDPDVIEAVPPVKAKPEVFDLSTLDDGRCQASSWRGGGKPPRRPKYETYFGPGGYNRCVGQEGHVNPLHRDEWGNVFSLDPFRVVRKEPGGVVER